MNSITVGASKKYEVKIGKGLLSKLGAYAAELKKPCKAAVITDDVVNELYFERVDKSLTEAGFSVCHFVFEHGEQQKNINTYSAILEFLSENALTRSDLIIALGGGVCGDMAGFAAATYLRGIDYIQLPTTFLSMIDSSVGGKTAIDLKAGKNLCGAFYQPILVLCDIETLDTLSTEIFADGAAEAIKYGVLEDRSLFDVFANGDVKASIEHIITRCVEIKRDYVEKDEFDTGLRMFLNLGHTVGHAVEKLSGFSITHGHAVAIGMSVIADVSMGLSLCGKEIGEKLRETLVRNDLPFETEFSAAELAKAALSDKKRLGGTINLILIDDIGKCEIKSVNVESLVDLLWLSDHVGKF